MHWTSRPFQGARDTKQIVSMLVAARREVGSACWHVGDLAWRFFLHGMRWDLGETIRLWHDDGGQLQAFAIWTPPGDSGRLLFDLQVHPCARGSGLEAEMLGWLLSLAAASSPAVTRLGTDTGVYDADTEQIAALQRLGFARAAGEALLLTRCLDEPIPDPVLPPGLVVRPLAGTAEVEPRVAAHRDAFHPSQLTVEAYRQLMDLAHYQDALDLVVAAPDGTLAAFCLVWCDAANGVGEFEPVGTRAAYHRQGLALALLLAGLHRLKEMGAGSAIVGPIDAEETATLALYQKAGLAPSHRLHFYVRR